MIVISYGVFPMDDKGACTICGQITSRMVWVTYVGECGWSAVYCLPGRGDKKMHMNSFGVIRETLLHADGNLEEYVVVKRNPNYYPVINDDKIVPVAKKDVVSYYDPEFYSDKNFIISAPDFCGAVSYTPRSSD